MNANGNASFGTAAEAHEFVARITANNDSLRALLALISDGACWLFPDGHLLALNRRCLALHGDSPEPSFPPHIEAYERKFFPAAAGVEHPLRQALRGEHFNARPADILDSATGEPRRLSWTTAYQDSDGTCLLVRETAGPRSVEGADEHFRLAVEAFPGAMVVLDSEGRIVLANHQTTRLFGYERESLVGEAIERILPTQSQEAHPVLQASVSDAPQSPEASTELVGMHSSGRALPVLVGTNRIRLDRQEYVVCAFTDNSARKRAEENIRRINEQLWRKQQEMEQFVYSVSHDLKSPLVTVTGFVGMLKEDIAAGNSDGAADSVGRIERATRRMSALIDDLLQLSRIGRVEIERQSVALQEVIQDLEQDLSDQFRASGARLHVDGTLPTVSADRAQVVEVFDNLISNALKYGCTKPGGAVRVGSQMGTEEVQIWVQDDGPGIPPAYHEKIFQAFQRLSNQTEGTGVGLAIVEKIMRTHGGRVWVESEEGKGARFWVAFPERPM